MDKAIFKYNGGLGALLCSKCRVIMKLGSSFNDEEISAIKGMVDMPPQYCKQCKNNTKMKRETLPKWGDLNTLERHRLVGELIDAMIYSGEAVMELKTTVERFKLLGYVRSVILPTNDCHHCDGEGCGYCVNTENLNK